MKNSKYKFLWLFAILLFFVMVPFLQSLFFSKATDGSISVSKEVRADYIKSDKKIVLLFFGYVGCKYVCTPDLEAIATLYESQEFKEIKDKVDVIFVNLKPEVGKDEPDLFAKSFDSDFKGVYLSKAEIQNIDRGFGISFSDDLEDKTQLNHSDNLYLIQNSAKGKLLRKIYFLHPLNSISLTKELIELEK